MNSRHVDLAKRSLAAGLCVELMAALVLAGNPAGKGAAGGAQSGAIPRVQRELRTISSKAIPLLDTVGDLKTEHEREIWRRHLRGMLGLIISKERQLQDLKSARGQ
jgi:hypothetical protein